MEFGRKVKADMHFLKTAIPHCQIAIPRMVHRECYIYSRSLKKCTGQCVRVSYITIHQPQPDLQCRIAQSGSGSSIKSPLVEPRGSLRVCEGKGEVAARRKLTPTSSEWVWLG